MFNMCVVLSCCVCVLNALECYYVLCVTLRVFVRVNGGMLPCVPVFVRDCICPCQSLLLTVCWVSTEVYRKEGVRTRIFNTDFHHIINQAYLILHCIALYCIALCDRSAHARSV